MIRYAHLPDRAVLAVGGEDAAAFLQGLISNDIRKATAAEAVFTALLSPQGKFLHDFFLFAQDGRFLLDTEQERLPDLKKRLAMYRLRSKVELQDLPQLKVAAIWGEGATSGYADPRLAALGRRVISSDITFADGMRPGDYDAHRLSLGVPDGSRDLIVDRSLLLEYGYDELNAIDFTKGCYVGQEVTARSKHRATLHKFIHCVTADAELPPKGTQVMAGEKEAGVMASHAGGIGLALLRVDAVKSGAALSAAGVALQAALPGWCRTAFSASAK